MSRVTKTAAMISGASIGLYHGYKSDFHNCAEAASHLYGAESAKQNSLDLTLELIKCSLYGVVHGVEESLVGGLAAYGAATLAEYYMPDHSTPAA